MSGRATFAIERLRFATAATRISDRRTILARSGSPRMPAASLMTDADYALGSTPVAADGRRQAPTGSIRGSGSSGLERLRLFGSQEPDRDEVLGVDPLVGEHEAACAHDSVAQRDRPAV